MDEIITELSKPTWWVSVVIAGIVINLFSAYLKSQIDRTVLSSLTWWREKSAKRRKEWALRVRAIVSNKEKKADEMHAEIMQQLESVGFLLYAILMLLMPLLFSALQQQPPRFILILSSGFSAFAFFASFLNYSKAAITRSALNEAQKKLTNHSSRTPNCTP